MRSLLIERRTFLKAAGILFVSGLSARGHDVLAASPAVFASAFMDAGGAYGVALLAEDGGEIARVALPDRGHDVSFDPLNGRAVAFARRPGTFALVIDTATGAPLKLIQAAEDRHFFGHGAFSPDGKRLYVAENDFDNYAGKIGVYDISAGWTKIGEFSAHGMDTHDIQILEGGRYLAIANGGIKQHPSMGRAKLNLDHMQPSLVIIDLSDGRLVEKHDLPAEIRQLSTRHMDIDASGRVWFGCQYEGPKTDTPQLLGSFKRGEDLRFLDMPEDVLRGFDNYIGSVMVNRDAGLVAVSSPKGGQWAAFDVKSHGLVREEKIGGVCGLAAEQATFIRSTETGWFEAQKTDLAWDNHITRLA
ncbi:hypothetical protein M2360_000645 [Rhizobium sp. SG_E_25_P2]|uniref:DUF1513 domain-containing protein n=1 Tax=Rhizobium sp. SG_E_25_P2 TaxID=2879942 RepID=UPI002473D19E|nr:DUF1513 domain-containing protein [Rhizobium sp. SG_E_25_P2]MDH6265264.1 hypothetical protein [Rhizobium sp. SG_E_25_P2]